MTVDFVLEVRCRRMWLLSAAADIPSLVLFKWLSRFVRFEYRTPQSKRWRLAARAYDVIDWDHFGDDDDEGGRPVPSELMKLALQGVF